MSTDRCVPSITISLLMACYGFFKRSLTLDGSLAGFVIGFWLVLSSYSFMVSLLTFFLVASRLTKWRAGLKKKMEEEQGEAKGRDWLQVVCNGGVASLLSFFYFSQMGSQETVIDFNSSHSNSFFSIQSSFSSMLSSSVLAAICCSCGDTLSSEVGMVTGNGDPLLITTLKRVPRGTNGGVSFWGFVASGVGGCLVGTSFFISNFYIIPSSSFSEWKIIPACVLLSFVGSLIDSIIGGILQYSGYDKRLKKVVGPGSKGKDVVDISGVDLLDNNNVNLASSLLTSLVGPFVIEVKQGVQGFYSQIYKNISSQD